MGHVLALIIQPDGSQTLCSTPTDLDTMQSLVGGNIEQVSGDGPWFAFCDEDGKSKALPANEIATQLAREHGSLLYGEDVLVGPVVFLGSETEVSDASDVPMDIIDAAHRLLIQSRPKPPAWIPSCRHCRSTQVTVQYSAIVSVNMHDGHTRYIEVSGVLGGAPDALACGECGHLDEQYEANPSALICEQTGFTDDGWTIYPTF